MAFEILKAGAWMEPEETVERYDKDDGVWLDCENAERYKDGAWEEVWANVKWFKELESTIPYGMYSPEDDGMKLLYWKIMDTNDGSDFYGTISGSGKLIVYVDGEWESPHITFDYEGGFVRNSKAFSAGTWQQSSAGKISLYGVESDGTVWQLPAVTAVGKSGTGAAYFENAKGSYDGQNELPGRFWRLGLVIEPMSYSGNFYSALLEIAVSNVRINGRKVGFSMDIVFDNQEM